MSVERTVANYLRIAREDLEGARILARSGNRNAVYLAQQAAEKTIRAVLTAEGLHAGVRHDLRAMVDMLPDGHPLEPLLVATVPLAAYATTYRYPTTSRIPPAPSDETLEAHLANAQAALDAAAAALGVALGDPGATTRGRPPRE